MVYCAHHRTLPVVGLCTSPISTRRRSLHVADLFALNHLISLLFGCNDLRSPVVAEIWSDFGFCGVVVFWVCESLWVSVRFSASASGFFFPPVVVAGMDMGLLG